MSFVSFWLFTLWILHKIIHYIIGHFDQRLFEFKVDWTRNEVKKTNKQKNRTNHTDFVMVFRTNSPLTLQNTASAAHLHPWRAPLSLGFSPGQSGPSRQWRPRPGPAEDLWVLQSAGSACPPPGGPPPWSACRLSAGRTQVGQSRCWLLCIVENSVQAEHLAIVCLIR